MVSKLLEMHIGAEVPKQLENDHYAEEGAIKAYNAAIVVAGDVADFATREVLEDILKDEDRHIDKIEELQGQINHMTVSVFLSTQVGWIRSLGAHRPKKPFCQCNPVEPGRANIGSKGEIDPLVP